MTTKRQPNKWKPIFITGRPGVGKTEYALGLAKDYKEVESRRFLVADIVQKPDEINKTDDLKVIIIDEVPTVASAIDIYEQIIAMRFNQETPYPEMMVFISNSVNERQLKQDGVRERFYLVQIGPQYKNSNGRN
jgi:broad-specificity NMP kinase